ncbi:uncharacterized protein MKZ38_005646 [Zalerion maritima]|uniref:Sodium/calcium exchanger membrane region domain-containing protein n=1 Tax=Zalerion maritima TaxID=339359 RepID=A0AAD5RXJ6_9PEZI|nr:uncharacterized protein MKZ38_005646 [Zalerion maritima]
MTPLRTRQRKLSSRPFTIALLILTTLATYAYLSNIIFKAADNVGSGQSSLLSRDLEVLSKKNRECRQLHHAKDKCKYVRKYCDDENAGLIPYLSLYYCQLGDVQPLAFVVLVAWTGTLFSTIGIAASDFFSVNLSTIATILGLSESLAGVTFLAFGNGSPDVFSTFAAMGSNSASMAVGELIGAAGFITTVVAGSMALVREFKVSKKTYVRDICFFIVAVIFTFVILIDGTLRVWECVAMIGFYLFYVVTVVIWHWYTTRRQSRRAREAASRSNFASSSEEIEPYRDDEEDEDQERIAGDDRRRPEAEDIRALEEGPRIELEDEEDTDGYQDRGIHVAAEMASSMRVMRPRGRRSTTTITPIRPSLVGALEFRSILSSLQRERNMRLTPISLSHGRSYSTNHLERSSLQPIANAERQSLSSDNTAEPRPSSITRDRALSSGDTPIGRGDNVGSIISTAIDSGSSTMPSPLMLPQRDDQARARSPSPAAAFKVGGKLAPPPAPGSPSPKLQLTIPNRSPPRSETSSPALSPFPTLMESPMAMSPSLLPQTPRSPNMVLPSPSIEPSHGIDSPQSPKPVKWWPYNVLPPPHILTNTIFPTLQGWQNKGIWDKFVSVVSVPSIFFLVITLPVVETDSCKDEADDSEPDRRTSGHNVPPVSLEPEATPNANNEWQRYRRSTRSHSGINSPNQYPSPLLISIESPHETRNSAVNGPNRAPREMPAPKPTGPGSDTSAPGSDNLLDWNRWLVALQMITGPLFVVCILWANMMEELPSPKRTLEKLILYSLLFSLVLLGILFLTTSPNRRPRFHYSLCFLGFIISIAWISTVAGEVVGVLKAFGVIFGISEAILGLTIFAVGNSLGDLVADVTVARLGYPVMALSACFGGPMLNILLGIGIGGLFYQKGLHIEVGGTLILSAISLLVTLVVHLVVVPLNKWVLSRRIGWGLIVLWAISTTLSLIIELSGVWRDVE